VFLLVLVGRSKNDRAPKRPWFKAEKNAEDDGTRLSSKPRR
jgi:hypothetical protein